MALYCGIDLHSRDCWLAILDEGLKVVHESKVGNDLPTLLQVLEPYREDLEGIAVESTYNWYWLVDGLSEAGYKMHLVNTWAVKQWEGLKYTDDRHDARWLAHLLSLGILPEGWICPKQERSVRDLLRRRAFLVRKRTSFLLAMRGAFECRTGRRTTSNEIRQWTAEEIKSYLDDEIEALGITCLLEPMNAVNDQIRILEKEALRQARLRDQFAPLLTVWGIGKILGLTVMYEVGEIARFRKVGKLRFVLPAGQINQTQRRQAQGIRQPTKRKPLSVVGVFRSGPFRGALPPRSQEVLSAEDVEDQWHRRHQDGGTQARKSGLLRDEGPGPIRSGKGIRIIRCAGVGARSGAGETIKV